MLITRKRDFSEVKKRLKDFPVVAILGPRQCGKTTLAKAIKANHYFDLENSQTLRQFQNPQLALETLKGTIVIDEIQRQPELFPLLRYLVDEDKKKRFLILGSASRDLIQQSSETLAGRISYHELSGFSLADIKMDWKKLWLQGGMPRSYLAQSNEKSFHWREQYIQTFLERDIPQLGFKIPARTLDRFWHMVAHYHGQMMNFSELSRSFGASDTAIRHYLEILEGTFILRKLMPWHTNLKKRLVKSPKFYIRDSGIFHTLLSIDDEAQLTSHPKLGASWEGFALECLLKQSMKPSSSFYFWATHAGAELDLFWQHKGKNWGAEFKYADAPHLTPSMRNALIDLRLEHLWVIYPGKETYKLTDKITVIPITEIAKQKKKINDFQLPTY